jgi:hypothetical protein
MARQAKRGLSSEETKLMLEKEKEQVRETKRLKGVSLDKLIGQTVAMVGFGHPCKQKHGSYGAYTLTMESGERFVLSCNMYGSELDCWHEGDK